MDNPLNRQAGAGNPTHYTRWQIQPVEFAMRNGWDFCASSSLKYICRFPFKEGLIDLEKGFHFGELRRELIGIGKADFLHFDTIVTIKMARFIALNEIADEATADTLMYLDLWVRGVDDHGNGFFNAMKRLMEQQKKA